MYPLKFEKFLVEKVWGGHKFNEILNIKVPNKNSLYGESWEISTRAEGTLKIINGKFEGKTLAEVIEIYKEQILGEKIWKKFKGNFPLLIKYLDINDKLSVQVHPDDEYALKHENDMGKSECWYVMDASEDAKLIIGLKKGVTKEIFQDKIRRKDFSNLFNIVPVKKGDFIKIDPGIVHATVEGSILICETQQNSNVTYRIYDFDRMIDGVKRELHLEKAVEVINFSEIPKILTEVERKKVKIMESEIEELTRCHHFNIDKLNIKGKLEDEINKNFKIYSILKGSGELIYENTKYDISTGDTFFIPANLKIIINGNLEILKSYL
jgi:mannose-6-phosphate isomerase